jgi:alkanesulfonate monooxygenase SsuD/methylene tetrahydromethanopterin reductase-like flavin-dependent oxidoreductase (luciferase family)
MEATAGPPHGTIGLRVDLLLDPFGTRWAQMRDAATAAADAGFDGIWTYDHLDGHVFGAHDVLECWTVLSGLAAVVPEVILGPLVLNVANRHPGVLATMAATLQGVSGGRLLLGLGAGARPGTPYAREQESIGRPVLSDAERRRDVEQCAVELRRFWRTSGFLRPDPEPPVVIAAFGAKMAHLAGHAGDGINTRATHPQLAELLSVARDAYSGTGRDVDHFLTTVFTEFDENWLEGESTARAHLVALGVHRLILGMSPPFDLGRIAVAGRLLAR